MMTYQLKAEYRGGRTETIQRRGGGPWYQEQAARSAAATRYRKAGPGLVSLSLIVERRDAAGRIIDTSIKWLY